MKKIFKLFRGFQLLFLNSIYFDFKFKCFKYCVLIILHIFITYLFLKIKNKSISYIFFKWTRKFKLSRNYFMSHCPIWYEILKNNQLIKKKINILEIGTFEGMSLLFYEKFLNAKKIYAIDPLTISKLNTSNFYYNIKKFNNIKFFKMKSDEFFKKKINIKFDIIYIDGSHYAQDVYKDLVNSFNILKNGGIIFLDDFLFDYDVRKSNYKFYETVMGGFFMFLKKYTNFKILYMGHQLIIKKNIK